MERPSTPHIAIIPTPGIGHLIPLAELARRLTEFNLSFTFLIPNDTSAPPTNSHLSLFNHLPPSITHHFLSPVDLSDLPSESKIETRISLTMTRSIPFIRDSLRVMSESTRLVALLFDLLGSPLIELSQEFGVSPYIFFLGNALCLNFAFLLPHLDKTHTCEYRDLAEPVRFFPGSVPVHGADFIDPVQNRQDDAYKQIFNMVSQYHKSAGILVNSFLDLEPLAFKHLMESGSEKNIPPVFPIGPVVQTGSRESDDSNECLKWLDKQPNESVLFVSFGSGGTLSHEQLIELALGLELSGQRFLLIVKSPHDKVANASYFSGQTIMNPLEFLPNGFLERTQGLGLVVHTWAPQVSILSHRSIGGFLTHCGWNSVLESMVHGIPLIAWPLFAEQRCNSVLLAEELRVALRVKPNEKGLIGREQIASYAQRLIEGKEGKLLRDKMRGLKHAAEKALDENGSSKQSLTKLAHLWKSDKSIEGSLPQTT